jgi:hypothetical protein
MSSSTLRRTTAVSLVFGLVTLTSSGALLAGSTGTLTGRVLAQNGTDPRAGVVVTLVEAASEHAYRSSPTDARGAFTISTAPPGSYALVVEAPEGAFLASNDLRLAPGMNRPLALALKPGKADEPPSGAPPQGSAKRGGTPTWAKWVIAGGIVVGAAIVIDAVTKDTKEASAF